LSAHHIIETVGIVEIPEFRSIKIWQSLKPGTERGFGPLQWKREFHSFG
jgi:hypothetical protein